MIRTSLLTLLISAGVAVTPGFAQSYERLDRNGDGVITRSEWRGNLTEFRNRDWNGDGVLSGDEIYGTRNNNSRYDNDRYGNDRYSGDTGYRNRSVDSNAANTMNRLDKNRDGAIQGYEWPYNAQVFHQLDRDENSVLTPDELSNMSQATMRDLDRNGNGRIDDEEWPGGFAQFDRLDQNRDGRVSADEYAQRGTDWQRHRRFEQWDINNDSRISMNEWKGSAASFRRLDRNRDNFVDADEFMANTDAYDRPFGWR